MTAVALLTDFGTVDGYVGEMKGVLLDRAPGVPLLDVTHSVEPGDIEGGAWVLARVWERFPPGTVHLVVIDPGVGSARRPLAARAADRWFVGPDNGLLTLVLERREVQAARRLDPERVALPELSDTFHGRDLFAPAAAHLAAGRPPEQLGPSVEPGEIVRFEVARAERDGDVVRGRVVHVDRFGNLITNLPSGSLPERPVVEIAGREIRALGRSFAGVDRGELVLIRGSGGTLEIAVREASAAVRLGVGTGEPALLRRDREGAERA